MMKKITYHGLNALASYSQQYKFRISFIVFGYILATVCLTIIPVFIGLLVGEVAKPDTNQTNVNILVAILIACSFLHQIFWHGIEVFFIKYILPPVFQFEKIIMQNIIEKPYPYFTDKFTGKISAHVDTIFQEVNEFTHRFFYSYTTEIVRLVGISLILLSINTQTLLIFLGGLTIMVLIGRKTIHNSILYEKEYVDIRSSKTGWIVDAISNFANIKSFHTEIKELNEHHARIQKTTKASQRAHAWSVIFWASVGNIVRAFIWPATIIMNVILYQNGEISLAQLTTLLSAILLFSDYIWEVVRSIIMFNLSAARLEEAYTYLFGDKNITKEHAQTYTNLQNSTKFKDSLAIRNLNFSYPDNPNEYILKNITIDIKKGEKIGVVGKSGSGKSTLTKILLGYYPANKSCLLIDSTEVSSKEVSSLVSFVPQDPSLFHKTIAENIAYAAKDNVTQKEIELAAKKANAHQFILSTKQGYDSLVGERGIKLSGGQRQRIAIARAILRKSPILILDEATSALDSESEKLIQQSFDKLMQHQTTIVIAHRLSTIAKMDRIIVLDNGQIIEEGNHRQLLKKRGTYYRLWAHQSGGFIEQ